MRFSWKWRVLALIGLLLYMATILLALRIVLHNLGLVLLIAITSLVLVFAGWLVFSGVGRRFKTGLILLVFSVGLLIAEFLVFIRDLRNVRWVLVMLIVGALYVSLFSILRNRYWLERRARAVVENKVRFKHPFLIINPKSGNGRAIKAHIPDIAHRMGIKTIVLQKGDDVENVARKAVERGAEVLGVSGGDGSIGAVAKVALEYNVPIVVLPGGTRCHFARDLGMDPKRIVDALAGFSGVERRIDAGTINDRVFLNNASFGLYADIVDNPDYRDHKLAVTRGVLQDIAEGRKEAYDLQFKHGKRQFTQAAQVLIGVNRYEMLNVFELGQRHNLDKGILHVNVIAKLDDQLIRSMLKSVSIDLLGKTDTPDDFYDWETKSFTINNHAKTMIIGVDGEREEYKTPVKVRCLPGALRIYVPAEGVRSRPKHAMSRSVAKQLWNAAIGRQ